MDDDKLPPFVNPIAGMGLGAMGGSLGSSGSRLVKVSNTGAGAAGSLNAMALGTPDHGNASEDEQARVLLIYGATRLLSKDDINSVLKSAGIGGLLDLGYQLLTRGISFLQVASVDDFRNVLAWIVEAEKRITTGAERKVWLKAQVDALLPYAWEFVRDALIGLGLAFLNKRGVISIKSIKPEGN